MSTAHTNDLMYARLNTKYGTTTLGDGLARLKRDKATFGGPLTRAWYATRLTALSVTYGTSEHLGDLANRFWAQTAPLGPNGLVLDGSAGCYAEAPHSASLAITGDIDVRVYVAMGDWTPAALSTLVAKWGGTDGYALYLESDGKLHLQWYTGAGYLSRLSTVAVSTTDGQANRVRVTLDVDNGAAGHDAKFYTSSDGSAWTQLGATVTTAGTTAIAASTGTVEIGARASALRASGRFYSAQIYNGIGGTLVASPDFTFTGDPWAVAGATTYTDSLGNVWTLNGTAYIAA